eukprot:SAG31_NODE_2026_length_6641_cov_3.312290_7_plen_588_part_00
MRSSIPPRARARRGIYPISDKVGSFSWHAVRRAHARLPGLARRAAAPVMLAVAVLCALVRLPVLAESHGPSAAVETALPPNITKRLLLDHRTVSSTRSATLVPGKAVKHPQNPLLSDANVAEMRPWEVRYDNMQPNVYFDRSDSTWKLWYSSWTTCDTTGTPSHGTKGDACSTKGYWPCTGVAAPQLGAKGRTAALMYAESKDGVTWTKPAVGAVKDSSTVANKTDFSQNNIVVLDTTGTGVLVDECAPPSQRYKIFGELNGPGGHRHSRALGVSADGIHWNMSDFEGSSVALDRHGTHNNLVFDPASQKYYGFGRPSNSPFRTEGVSHSVGPEFLGKWTASAPCGLEIHENKTYQPDALVVMSEPYAGVWLGFANMLSVTTPTAASSAGTTEIELAYSVDLLNWRYVAHGTPFIPRGAPGSYDCCELFGAKQQPFIRGDKMHIFYTAGNGPFMGSRAAGFSMATLQRDWWFGYTSTQNTTSATIFTAPVTVGSSGMLLVSADARYGGVSVGVVAARPIKRLAVGNCVKLRGNLTDAPVRWKVAEATATDELSPPGAAPLALLVGANVTLEFRLDPGAVLFAFDLPN